MLVSVVAIEAFLTDDVGGMALVSAAQCDGGLVWQKKAVVGVQRSQTACFGMADVGEQEMYVVKSRGWAERAETALCNCFGCCCSWLLLCLRLRE